MPTFQDLMQFDFRIAEIIDAVAHPDADRLLVLQVQVGEVQKQIVAGIRSAYTPEELIGKQILVVNNLDPATIRGIESQGMLLAASDDAGVCIMIPQRPVVTGSRVK